MRFIVPVVLIIVAVIHFLPLSGVLGPSRLSALYGVAIDDPGIALLLRHRAVLFGLLAAFLAYAAFRPGLHGPALVAGVVSVASFLVLAWPASSLSQPLAVVFKVDVAALVLLSLAGAVHLRAPDAG